MTNHPEKQPNYTGFQQIFHYNLCGIIDSVDILQLTIKFTINGEYGSSTHIPDIPFKNHEKYLKKIAELRTFLTNWSHEMDEITAN